MSDSIQLTKFPVKSQFGTSTADTGRCTIQLSSAVQRRGIIFVAGKKFFILYVTSATEMTCSATDGTTKTVIANGNYNFTITDLDWWSDCYAIIV